MNVIIVFELEKDIDEIDKKGGNSKDKEPRNFDAIAARQAVTRQKARTDRNGALGKKKHIAPQTILGNGPRRFRHL